jgi:hypothetical protein
VTEPPSGTPPPVTATLRDGTSLDLRALAHKICKRYRSEFPDERARYGDAGTAWCIHDNQHLLNWAVTESKGLGGFTAQLEWLIVVLHARAFPLDRLARNLEIAAAVLNERGARLPGPAAILADGAHFVRLRASSSPAPD